MREFHPEKLLQALCASRVEFVLVGGVAAAVHGLARSTYDLDIVYKHTLPNCDAIANALAPFHPYLRELPAGLPFVLTKETLFNGMNFTLTTTAGDLDLLGEVPGVTDYDELVENSDTLRAYDSSFLCVRLDKLIKLKRSAGRARDLEMLAQLELLRDNLKSQSS